MAYTFQNVLDTVNDENQGSNIFAPQGDQAGQTQQNLGASGGVGNVGSISSGGGAANAGSVAPQNPQSNTQQNSGASAGRAVTRNIGRQQAPVDTNQISQKIRSAQEGLQNEANQYVTGQQQKAKVNIGDDDIEGAIGGNNYDAFSKITNLLGQGQAGPVEQFKPQTETEIKDVKNIQSEAGIANLMRRKQGPLYTAGEAALDTSLLRKDKGFSQARQDLVGQQQKLRDFRGQETDVTTGAQKRAQDAANAELAAGQQGLKGTLASKRGEFEKAQQAELAAEQAARRAAYGGEEEKAFAAAQKEAMYKKHGINDDSAGNYVTRGKIDELDWKHAVNQDEANRYNRIRDLLGDGGETLVGREFDPRFGFNEQAYVSDVTQKAAIRKAEQERQAREDQEKANQTNAAREQQYNAVKSKLDALLAGRSDPRQNPNAGMYNPLNDPEIQALEKELAALGGTKFVTGPNNNLGIDGSGMGPTTFKG